MIVAKSKVSMKMNSGEKFEIKDILKLTQLPNSLLGDNVDINAVADFLTSDAWTRWLKLLKKGYMIFSN